MKKPTILVAGKWEANLLTLRAFDNHHTAWATTEAATAEEAIEKFHQKDFDAVILADGLSGEEEKKLRKVFTIQNPDIIIMSYSDSLLADQIQQTLITLRKARKPSITLVDDALKNAGLNIIVQ